MTTSQTPTQVLQTVFNNIIANGTVNLTDIQNLIFNGNVNVTSIINATTFNQIVECFDFTGTGTVTAADFTYLISHISNITVITNLVKLIALCAAQVYSLKCLGLNYNQMVDIVVEIILYCIVLVCAQDCPAFVTWAQQTSGSTTNGALLINVVGEVITYIQSTEVIGNVIQEAVTYFQTKLSGCKCSCLPATATTATTVSAKYAKANVEMRSAASEIKEKLKLHILSKSIIAKK